VRIFSCSIADEVHSKPRLVIILAATEQRAWELARQECKGTSGVEKVAITEGGKLIGDEEPEKPQRVRQREVIPQPDVPVSKDEWLEDLAVGQALRSD
jgi:hypothetical protein